MPPVQPEQAQIEGEGAADLYKEIRVANTLQDENGKDVALKPGVKVEVTIEADKQDTVPKKSPQANQARRPLISDLELLSSAGTSGAKPPLWDRFRSGG